MNTQPASAYFLETTKAPVESHTLSIVVDNEPGVLARVIGLFSGRGYNIESLTVSETEHESHVSRITIVTSGTAMVLEQIRAQLERLVPVHSVADLTVMGNAIERELALIKVAGVGEHEIAEVFADLGPLAKQMVNADDPVPRAPLGDAFLA